MGEGNHVSWIHFDKKNQVIKCERKLAAINSIFCCATEVRCKTDLVELNTTVNVISSFHDLNEQTK